MLCLTALLFIVAVNSRRSVPYANIFFCIKKSLENFYDTLLQKKLRSSSKKKSIIIGATLLIKIRNIRIRYDITKLTENGFKIKEAILISSEKYSLKYATVKDIWYLRS